MHRMLARRLASRHESQDDERGAEECRNQRRDADPSSEEVAREPEHNQDETERSCRCRHVDKCSRCAAGARHARAVIYTSIGRLWSARRCTLCNAPRKIVANLTTSPDRGLLKPPAEDSCTCLAALDSERGFFVWRSWRW